MQLQLHFWFGSVLFCSVCGVSECRETALEPAPELAETVLDICWPPRLEQLVSLPIRKVVCSRTEVD